MRKNISIDELFRQGLSEGREQLNLGAWANMERLLDGKQPYSAPDEEKRKRRIIPFFWLLFIVFIGTTGTLFVKHKMSGKGNSHEVLTANLAHQVKPSEILTEEKPSADINNPQVNSEIPVQNTTYHQEVNASNSATPITQSSSTENTERKNVIPAVSVQTPTSTKNNAVHTSIPTKQQHHQQQAGSSQITPPNAPNQTAEYSLAHQSKGNHINSIHTSDYKAGASQISVLERQETASSKATASSPITDTLEQITRVERVTGSRQGRIERSLDTINTSQQVVTKEESKPIIDYHQSNPRYVDLDETQAKQSLKTEQLAAVPMEKAETKSHQDIIQSVSKSKTSEHSSWKESLENTRIKLGNALNTVSIKKILAYPGITAGVNAALFTASHNYGGFHAGVSNLTPINDHLAFLSEIRFFYRSNSGYSIQDIQSSMKGFSKDTMSLYNQQQTIYAYDMDSSVRRYNFKHMYSIEMPLSIQYNLNRLSFYGGVNLAYNARLNTTVVSSNPVSHHYDTLSNNATFIAPTPSNYKYVNDDFKSRFGMGYMLGTSYAFSPNVYLDLRATQTQWDNSKTVTSRAVSSSVFKIPYVQFSFGYRFKKYTPGGN